jgi:hypothetical protein
MPGSSDPGIIAVRGQAAHKVGRRHPDHSKRGIDVNIIKGRQASAETELADGTGGGTAARRSVLGGLAALPVLYAVASATPALASPVARPAGAATATDDLVRGQERRHNAPLLTAGTRLLLPSGVKAVPVVDYYHRPHLASTASAWPHIRAANGTTVDASVIPARGAATRVAIVSGFTDGWYELAHANGRADRVSWDARKLPYLFVYGEFGGTDEEPFHSQFYSLALQPMSRNPYLRSTSIN